MEIVFIIDDTTMVVVYQLQLSSLVIDVVIVVFEATMTIIII